MNCRSFATTDIVHFLRDHHNINGKHTYHRIWSTLRSSDNFKQTVDKRWHLVSKESTISETTKPKRPSVIHRNTSTKTTKENVHPVEISYGAPTLSLLLICAKLLRNRDLTKKELYKEISSQYPFYKPTDRNWKKIVNTHLDKFCIKFSSKLSTSYSISEDTYVYIYKNEVIHKEFDFSN